jgi:hypothetical protein
MLIIDLQSDVKDRVEEIAVDGVCSFKTWGNV